MIETLAVIFTIIDVWLTTKRHILTWPVGIIGVILYGIVFWNSRLYSDFGLQFVFLAQSIVGWITWSRHLEDVKTHTRVTCMTPKEMAYWFSGGIWAYIILAIVMKKYTNAAVPWVDSFVAVFSLIANWLLAKRKLENWYVWILANTIYVGLFLYKGLYLSSVLYAGLIYLDIVGLKDWTKKLKEQFLMFKS
jgi:nicotinamide mononucleotide transporter